MTVGKQEGMAARPHVVVLGGGPAGCGAAYQLRRLGRASVTLIERQDVVGGNAGSFEWGGQRLDYGSHRLHHACDPKILADIRGFLGDDLASRPRQGRIRLRGKWLHFPPKTFDLMRRLDKGMAIGMVRDAIVARLARRDPGDSFASVLMASLGPTMCRHFYFPYARKIWGREPELLSGVQAKKRVSAGSFAKLVKRLVKAPGGGHFYYPRRGFGQITEAYAERARELGADLVLGWAVERVERIAPGADPDGHAWRVFFSRDGEQRCVKADHVWSTLPTPLLARMVQPSPPADVIEATGGIDYRAMLLVYLRLDVDRFTPTDAHYFPEENVALTRLSEPKNYFGGSEPRGSTVLCAEVPCAPTDATWSMTDAELGARVVADLERAGLTLERPPVGVHVRRLRQAYPIYTSGYERPFGVLDAWAGSLPNLLVYGRQGLFAHDNTHHALAMAYAAAECLEPAGFNESRWAEYRKVFATHVVED